MGRRDAEEDYRGAAMTDGFIVSLERGTTRETFHKLRDLGYLVVIELEFNHDSQLYEMHIRSATTKDI